MSKSYKKRPFGVDDDEIWNSEKKKMLKKSQIKKERKNKQINGDY